MATSRLIPGVPSVIVPRSAPVETAPIWPSSAYGTRRILILRDARGGLVMAPGARGQSRPGHRHRKATSVLALRATRPIEVRVRATGPLPKWPCAPQGYIETAPGRHRLTAEVGHAGREATTEAGRERARPAPDLLMGGGPLGAPAMGASETAEFCREPGGSVSSRR